MANWTRDQLLAALNLYHRTPFGQQHKSHPPIIKLGGLIGRTPDAVAMKLSNFTSLDPIEKARGIKGFSRASNHDRRIWAEFDGRMNALAEESESALEKFVTESGQPEEEIDDRPPEGPSERTATVKVRRQQAFFRKTVLGSYGTRCCITDNPVPSLLRASHIVPWAKREKERANPSNGLCLAATFDAAFDRGLIALDGDFCVLLSDKLMSFMPNCELERSFGLIEGNPIKMPEKNLPDPQLVAWHREHVFLT